MKITELYDGAEAFTNIADKSNVAYYATKDGELKKEISKEEYDQLKASK